METQVDSSKDSLASLPGPYKSTIDEDNEGLADDATSLSLLDLLQSSSNTIDLSDHSASQYVDQLLSLSLHELLRQPQLISAETSTVESDLTNLCFREYPTFISVHKCSSAVSSAFDDFSGSLGKLIGAIPSLEDQCKTFSTNTGSIQNVRVKAALVQEHQDKLLDLLELPQLMETCVRNGYYQEAMELLNHCRSLATKYPAVALVQDVNKEVEGILQLMLAQLLALLREPVKLPALVKTVSFLRRMDAIDETELGLIFISSRYHNYRAQLTLIDRDKADPVRYLRKYIDLFREHVYDIIAQFTAIFLETSPSEVAAIHITSFANQAITDLVDLVTSFIPRISSDSGSMSSVLVQLGYCAMSFSRVGLDFAPLISAPFASSVLSTFSQSLSTASNDFSSILRNSAKAVLPPSQILVIAEHIPSIVSALTSPPALPSIDSISHFPPIATLINAYISAFNNLRLLAPLELHSQLVALHSSSLLASTSVLLQYVKQATTLSDDPPMSPVKSRPGHGRTPSTPRADLLRRNSEVLMTADARAAKRREAKRVCVASADVWCRMVVPFLMDKLNEGVFADVPKPDMPKDLGEKLEELESWVKINGEGSEPEEKVRINGNGDLSQSLHSLSEIDGGLPKTPPRKDLPLASSSITVDSPSQVSPKTPAIPNLATPTPKSTSSLPTKQIDSIENVFDPLQPSAIDQVSNGMHSAPVPAPENLQQSNADVIENMEVQLEAMHAGLTGEEAAVAVDVNHVAHQPMENQEDPRSGQKPSLDEAIDLQSGVTDAEAAKLSGDVNATTTEIDESPKTSAPGEEASYQNGSEPERPLALADQSLTKGPSTTPDADADREGHSVENSSLDLHTVHEANIVAGDDEEKDNALGDTPSKNGVPEDAINQDTSLTFSDEPGRSQAKAKDQDERADEAQTDGDAGREVGPSQTAAETQAVPSAEASQIEPAPELASQPQSTPTSADPSRVSSPIGDGDRPVSAVPTTSGGASKKKKKKKGKK
ncbi:uncharacterized protein I303_102478 [Kwoniella dejecticola CBS 10117]|uniref:Conserved oligomeric Golgi complex subunit 8 n=1 Tax=Kwoniella dejecticola CBS 10117 TaxID=1296121 RepID=A0A1A6A8V1_9TREE|nr:uncharacterized protein I303_02493 [Kwoniella dejecticola CBS 10117]OBR86486.1 hypothetical protein I303_02493 [Kwoniella dejecticola CBS 10117]